MDAAPAVIPRTTFATRTVGDTDAQADIIFAYPTSLISGDNVLAIEAHQVNLTSSDITMGFELSALPSGPVRPALSIRFTSSNITRTWSSANDVLQFMNDINGAWADVTPAPPAGGPYTVAVSATYRFYGLLPVSSESDPTSSRETGRMSGLFFPAVSAPQNPDAADVAAELDACATGRAISVNPPLRQFGDGKPDAKQLFSRHDDAGARHSRTVG